MLDINLKTCSEEELWKFVGAHLAEHGIDAVLVGGAVVSIYSKGAYKSGDLDFVVLSLFKNKLPEIMEQIGFMKTNRHYVHPDCNHLFVEFPPGPLGIGEDYQIEPKKITEGGKSFKILSPTDCIKDRLASYIYFKSQEGLEQALLVAKYQPFKMAEIKNWCKRENAEFAYEDFKQKL